MKIESAAGEFEFHIETLKVAGNDVVVLGKMGVWEAETSMSRDDVLKMLRLTIGNPLSGGSRCDSCPTRYSAESATRGSATNE